MIGNKSAHIFICVDSTPLALHLEIICGHFTMTEICLVYFPENSLHERPSTASKNWCVGRLGKVEDIVSHQKNVLQNPQGHIPEIQCRQPQLSNPIAFPQIPISIRQLFATTNSTRIQLSVQIYFPVYGILKICVTTVSLEKGPTLSKQSLGESIHGLNPLSGGGGEERERGAVPIVIAQRLDLWMWDAAVFQESQLEVALGEIDEEAEVGERGGGERGERQRHAVVWQRP